MTIRLIVFKKSAVDNEESVNKKRFNCPKFGYVHGIIICYKKSCSPPKESTTFSFLLNKNLKGFYPRPLPHFFLYRNDCDTPYLSGHSTTKKSPSLRMSFPNQENCYYIPQSTRPLLEICFLNYLAYQNIKEY